MVISAKEKRNNSEVKKRERKRRGKGVKKGKDRRSIFILKKLTFFFAANSTEDVMGRLWS